MIALIPGVVSRAWLRSEWWLNLLKFLKLPKDNNSKGNGVEKIPGGFVKDNTIILARPINDMFNIFIKIQTFPYYFKSI